MIDIVGLILHKMGVGEREGRRCDKTRLVESLRVKRVVEGQEAIELTNEHKRRGELTDHNAGPF